MPDLMIDLITSLEGCAAAEGWPGLWGLEGPEYLAWLAEEQEPHTVLMGATTYRLMSGFAAEGEGGLGQLDALPKVVFSSTLDEPLTWSHARVVREDAVAVVRRMKEDGDLPMRTLGSLSLCRSLLEAGLVDRLRLVVFPVVTGSSGREPVYAGWPDVLLEPLARRTFDGRLELLEYAPRVLDGPPGGGQNG
jgi:dihydrofolate reductase